MDNKDAAILPLIPCCFKPIFWQRLTYLAQRLLSPFFKEKKKFIIYFIEWICRLFKIRLRRSASVFAEDAVLENTHGPISYDKSKIYHGELEGIYYSSSLQ